MNDINSTMKEKEINKRWKIYKVLEIFAENSGFFIVCYFFASEILSRDLKILPFQNSKH